MGIFGEYTTIWSILGDVQIEAHNSAHEALADQEDNYSKMLQRRRKALAQIKEIVEKHYEKKGKA